MEPPVLCAIQFIKLSPLFAVSFDLHAMPFSYIWMVSLVGFKCLGMNFLVLF